jgi:hypothetical protein
MRIKKSFRENVSEIFSLKSKKKTLLFGTFVPFFFCHVYAYSCTTEERLDCNWFWVIGYSLLFILSLFGEIAMYCLFFVENVINEPITFGLRLFILSIACLGNFYMTLVYYEIFKDEKEKFPEEICST